MVQTDRLDRRLQFRDASAERPPARTMMVVGAFACALTLPAGAAEPVGPAASANVAAVALTGDSTLAEWSAADAADRTRVAVAMAKTSLAPGATKLEIATAAMEMTGCLSATARDPRFGQWKVAPTAATCLSAPERPLK